MIMIEKVEIINKKGERTTVECGFDVEACRKYYKDFDEFKQAHSHIISNLKPIWIKINGGITKVSKPVKNTKPSKDN